MVGYIQRIKTKVPYSTKEIDVDLQGRNLILTGGNGCGKTQLLNVLYKDLESRIVNKRNHDLIELNNNIAHYERLLTTTSKSHSYYDSYAVSLDTFRRQLASLEDIPSTLSNLEEFVVRYSEQKAVLRFFEATRQANIKESKSAVSKESLISQDRNNSNPQLSTSSNESSAEFFEQYLVSHKTSQAYAEAPSIDNDPEGAKRIRCWFDKLKNDFRDLFEDDSLNLHFNSKLQAFFIEQSGKESYRFQQLSSGFSSILSVYADLLTKVELRSISPNEINGVVFIDEIDAHLHVSLQRKIFSFLKNAFPKIQFIVTTHSPFVVSSVDDAVIYDLSTLEQVNDLSMYSYESILEGLFNVFPASELLKKKILTINKLATSESPDVIELERLVNSVRPHEEKLDSESAYFLNMAQLVISKSKGKGA